MSQSITYASTSRFVQAGATRIHYHEAGQGPVLLCLHGGAPGAFGWGNFGRNLEALSRHFRVLIADLPGYGQSDKPQVEEGRNAFYAQTFCDMLDALDIPRAHVLGMATGGAVAIRMALDHADKIDRLVLVSAAGGLSMYGVKAQQTASQIYYGGAGPSLEKMRAYLQQLVFDPALVTDEVVRERYEASVDPAFMVQAPEGRNGKRHTPESLWKDVDRIKAKTLLVWGRENRAQNFENAVFLHSRIRDSELHVFGQCGLWVPYEKADAFHRLVQEFLQR
jgi:4,5:9,10-diseco-3-hydroxy-5,9,17-trioxoandrosta-1(10),2-diene-4-oate hydrolase